ncbi:hypothetical protein N7462_002619 [Penicillium macrosclerotiorum]|uniref:uncharacterized protein n=1 Tax=Penicillium macrosclerotiorum TaxID=303699 RepID=UPI0025473D32|nr:uncharacterized protein N7462_002619 [Penicillium macrosclerotiorum]KAJ5693196.1 hypothetical protein N7462_002619 [Penicillium macrosclerotiorum]
MLNGKVLAQEAPHLNLGGFSLRRREPAPTEVSAPQKVERGSDLLGGMLGELVPQLAGSSLSPSPSPTPAPSGTQAPASPQDSGANAKRGPNILAELEGLVPILAQSSTPASVPATPTPTPSSSGAPEASASTDPFANPNFPFRPSMEKRLRPTPRQESPEEGDS